MKLTQPPLGTNLNRSHNLSRNMTLCYPFNEKGGKILTDVAGNKPGTILGTGSNWQPGMKGTGFQFNGTDDYVSSLYLSTPLMSISFWLRFPSAPGATNNTGVLFWNGTTVANFLTCEIAGANPDIGIFKANAAGFRAKTSQTVLKDGFWHHCVFVIDKASAAASDIYIDGTVLTGYTTTANQTFSVDTGFNINHWTIAGTNRFAIGIITDLKIFNRKLLSTEVRQLYTQSYSMFK